MTIRKRIFRALLLLLLVPVFLLVLSVGIVRAYFLGDEDKFSHGSPQSTPVHPETIRNLNKLVYPTPENSLDPARLLVFVDEHPTRGAVVLKNGRIAVATPPFDDAEFLPESISGARRELTTKRGAPRRNQSFVVLRWDFVFGDGDPGEVVLLGRVDWRNSEFRSGGAPLILTGIAMILLVNGIISWWTARKIVQPLQELERAAERIGEGQLDRGSTPRGDREIKNLFETFDDMRLRLKTSLESQLAQERSRRELIAGLSHDLRTPIAAIRGYVEGLKDGIPTSAEGRKRYLDTIDEKARHLERLVSDLFHYSRLELEGIEPDRREVDTLEMIAQIADELSTTYQNLTVKWTARERILVRADPDMLRRAFANIIENTARHAGSSAVSLYISHARGSTSSNLEIVFADNGPGITPGEEEKIFAGTYRSDRSRSQDTGGSGLGLAVARRVVEAHGARISAERADPSGLRVRITLPLENENGEGDRG